MRRGTKAELERGAPSVTRAILSSPARSCLYHTSMDRSAVKIVDEALIRMRRLWAPVTSGRPAPGSEPRIDLSTVLVVDSVSRLGEGPSVGQLADHLGVAQTTASRLADRAASSGFVAKKPSETDARRLDLSLTEAGRELLQRSLEFRYEYVAYLLEGWSSADISKFAHLLERFAGAVLENPPDVTDPRQVSAPGRI